MVIDDKRQFSIQSDHNWIVSVINANYLRIKCPTVKKTKWKVEKLLGGGAKKFAKAFGDHFVTTSEINLEELNKRIVDSLNKAGEQVVGKTEKGKKKKRSLPQPILEAYKKWRQCEQDLAHSIHELPPRTNKASREKDLLDVKRDKIICDQLAKLKSAKDELNALRRDNRRKMQANLLGKIKRNFLSLSLG